MKIRVVLRVIHVRVIVYSFVILYYSLVRRISGYVFCLYEALSFAAFSVFSFLSSLDLLSSTFRDNYNQYYIHQTILSILSFSEKPHRELTG